MPGGSAARAGSGSSPGGSESAISPSSSVADAEKQLKTQRPQKGRGGAAGQQQEDEDDDDDDDEGDEGDDDDDDDDEGADEDELAADKSETGGSSSSAKPSQNGSATTATGKAKVPRSSKACSYCQRLKMRCTGAENGKPPCHRCKRLGKECIFRPELRSKANRINKDKQIEMLAKRLAEMERQLSGKAPMMEAGDSVLVNGDKRGAAAMGGAMDGSARPPPAKRRATTTDAHTAYIGTNGRAGPGTMGPPSGTTPVASPANSAASLAASSPQSTRGPLRLSNHDKIPLLASGALGIGDAHELFNMYHNRAGDAICLLDPEWHTAERVSSRSPFLYMCMLNVAAVYHPRSAMLVPIIQAEVDRMIGEVITTGQKSVDIVQGLMLLYFWNKPTAKAEEDKAWVYSGLAIRIAAYLNLNARGNRVWGTRGVAGGGTSSGNRAISEEDREIVNRERTHLLLYCVDRTLSVAMGKQWQMKEDALILHAYDWCRSEASRPWDEAIALLVDLLRTFCRQFDIIHSSLAAPGSLNMDLDYDQIMPIFNLELEAWRSRGALTSVSMLHPEFERNIIAASPGGRVHVNIARDVSRQLDMRYHYIVLVLNSFALQYAMEKGPEKESLKTISLLRVYHSARGTIEAAREKLRDKLSYAPHTQYVILSYSIVTLLRLSSITVHPHFDPERALHWAELGTELLESVANGPMHTPARYASFLRALIRSRKSSSSKKAGSSQARQNAQPTPKAAMDGPSHAPAASENDPYHSATASSLAALNANGGHSSNLAPPVSGAHDSSGMTMMALDMPGQAAGGDVSQVMLGGGGGGANGIGGTPSHHQGFADLFNAVGPDNWANSRAVQAFQGLEAEAFSGLDRLTVDQILDDDFWSSLAAVTPGSGVGAGDLPPPHAPAP